MITKKMLKRYNAALTEFIDASYPIYKDLTIDVELYEDKWRYTFERRRSEGVDLDTAIRNLMDLPNWIKSKGLLEIEVRKGYTAKSKKWAWEE